MALPISVPQDLEDINAVLKHSTCGPLLGKPQSQPGIKGVRHLKEIAMPH